MIPAMNILRVIEFENESHLDGLFSWNYVFGFPCPYHDFQRFLYSSQKFTDTCHQCRKQSKQRREDISILASSNAHSAALCVRI